MDDLELEKVPPQYFVYEILQVLAAKRQIAYKFTDFVQLFSSDAPKRELCPNFCRNINS